MVDVVHIVTQGVATYKSNNNNNGIKCGVDKRCGLPRCALNFTFNGHFGHIIPLAKSTDVMEA